MEWIQHVAVGVFVGAFLMYANNKSAEKVERNTAGKFVLKLSAIYKWVGFIGVFISLGVIVAAIVFYEEGIFIWVFLIVLIFGGLSAPLLMYYYNHELEFDEESIVVKNWKGKVDKIKWSEIENVKFSPMWGYLKLKTKSKKLNLYQHLVGLVEFVKLMEIKTKFTAKELKLPFKVE